MRTRGAETVVISTSYEGALGLPGGSEQPRFSILSPAAEARLLSLWPVSSRGQGLDDILQPGQV